MNSEPLAFARATVDVSGDARIVSLQRQLGVENLGLNVFSFRRGEGSRIHRHREQEEVYFVLRGQLTLQLDCGEFVLSEFEVARVAPDLRRQLSNRGQAPCVFIAVGAAGAHRGGDAEAFISWGDREARSPADVPVPDRLV
jgi:quercetin dioxygenase-like cupin family protein